MKSIEVFGVKDARRNIIVYVLIFVVSLGLPLYYGTTSVYRADLPIAEINNLSDTLFSKVAMNIPVQIESDIGAFPADFREQLQHSIQSKMVQKYPEVAHIWNLNVMPTGPVSDAYKVTLRQQSGNEVYYIHPDTKEIDIFVDDHNLLVEVTRSVLLDEIFGSEIADLKNIVLGQKSVHDAIPQSEMTNIVFSLLVEDGKPVKWEVDQIVKQFDYVVKRLGHISEFQVSTQIQYYSSLTHEPSSLVDDDTKYIVAEEDLSTFINFGDWNINNYDIHPTVNFLIYFPKCNYENKRLLVQNSDTNSFLVPQWGGVHIFNKNFPLLRQEDPISITASELAPVFEIFAVQLLMLLGAPERPRAPVTKIDILTRLTTIRALKRTAQNLKSLVKVTNSLNEISIPDQTKVYVADCLRSIDKAISEINNGSNTVAVESSRQALLFSDAAFFDKEMVQQAYFPNEHKLAVFLPLLGPVASIITLSLIKMVKDWKQQRKVQKNADL